MKLLEPIYLLILDASIIRWLLIARDTMSTVIALLIGTLTVVYMFFKMKNEIINYRKSKKESNE